MDPNQNPPSERQWTPEEMEEFFSSQDAVTGLFPSGAVEECRCKERTFRKDFIEGMEAVQRLMKEDTP